MNDPKQGLDEQESEFMDMLLEKDTIRKQPFIEEDLGPVEQFVDELLESKLKGPDDEDEEEADGFNEEE